MESQKSKTMEYTINLLKEGDQFIELDQKNIVLLLGNTGAGKSTLTQFLAGDNSKLISKELGEETGEFIIVDSNAKISGNSSIFSQTIFPDLVVDVASSTAFYDCPGFSDTRNSSIDIANTYFIHKLIDYAETLKFVFVVNHQSLKTGIDRKDFMQMIEHATTLVKNVDKLKNSSALIATKVENTYKKSGKQLVLVSDDKVISNIGEYLENSKTAIQDQLNQGNNDSNKFYKNAIKFIDIFLDKKDGKFTKIAIFRRPDESGKVSDIEKMQTARKSMHNIIGNNIEFITKVDSDFGYTISDKSKNDINYLIEELNIKIAENTAGISNEILSRILQEESKSVDLLDFNEKLIDIQSNLQKAVQSIHEDSNPKMLLSVLEKIDIVFPDKYLKNISEQDKYLEFLGIVSEKSIKYRSFDWMKPIETAKKQVEAIKTIYDFLHNLYVELSRFGKKEAFDNAVLLNFKNSIIGLKNTKGEILKTFLEKVYEQEIQLGAISREYDAIKDLEFNEIQFQTFKDIIDMTLFQKNQVECRPAKISIRGNLIRTSEVQHALINCNQGSSLVEVFALNKIIIDTDFVQGDQSLQVIMIAPILEVIGTKTINLNGWSGESYPNAKDGVIPGGHGKSGMPGRPGKPGGHIFAYAKKFINVKNLVITANGGDGGNGQNGGSGGAGQNGRPLNCKPIELDLNCDTHVDKHFIRDDKSIAFYHVLIKSQYYLTGEQGTAGGNGGEGGMGGIAGRHGEIKFAAIDNSPVELLKIESRDGRKGRTGAVGSGGLGGTEADIYKVYKFETVPFTSYSTPHYHDFEYYSAGTKENDGQSGKPEPNTIGYQNPKIIDQIQNTKEIVNAYKDYATKNIHKINKRQLFGLTNVNAQQAHLLSTNYKLIQPRIPRSLLANAPGNLLIQNNNQQLQLPSVPDNNFAHKRNSYNFAPLNVFNSTLVLADLLVRKLTSSTKKVANFNPDRTYSVTFVKSLNIVMKFEKLLNKFVRVNNLSDIVSAELNSPELVGKIRKLLLNNNYAALSDLLNDSVKNHLGQYGTDFRSQIDEMLMKEQQRRSLN